MELKGETMAGIRKVRLDEVGLNITGDLSKYKLKRHADGSIELEVEPNNKVDHERAMEALALSIAPITPSPPAPLANSVPTVAKIVGLTETIANYEAIDAKNIREKSAYEYVRMQKKFLEWMQQVQNRRDPPMHMINRDDIKAYIKYLQTSEKLNPNTIDSKYLPALTNLFIRARRDSAYPDSGEYPTARLRILSKRQKSEIRAKQKQDKPYTIEELKLIFAPANLLTAKKPHQFWVPLIALFTGARLNEICQLHLEDIKQDDGIWAFHINQKGVKRLKTHSATREVPISQTLIDIGLLDYIEDVKALEGKKYKSKTLPAPKMLFPYLNRDTTGGHFTHDATRDWTAYLKWVGVTDYDATDGTTRVGGFHPFRYVFTNVLSHPTVQKASEYLLGHKKEGVTDEVYRQQFALKYLANEVMPQVKYPEVNFDGIRYETVKTRFNAFLVPAMSNRVSKDENRRTIGMKERVAEEVAKKQIKAKAKKVIKTI
jgi:integrase